MPNLSKKKGRRRWNPEREAAKAAKIIEKDKTEKFLKNQTAQGQSWKYGHLEPNQVMTGSDKLFHKKVIQISKSRGLADDSINENPYYKSQYNDDRNLTNFENDQIFRHQIRSLNNNDTIDASDSELENDSDVLEDINDNDEIFALRRKKKDQDADALLESSGDDLDKDYDDLLEQQNEDNTINIDTEIQNDNISVSDIESEEDMPKSNKRRRGRRSGVNLNEIERHIMDGDDENKKRMFQLSKQFNSKKDKDASESDNSSYYNSDSDANIDDMDRNSEQEDDNIAEEGVGKIYWGDSRKHYYGADADNTAFQRKSDSVRDRRLRDEELIGMQMQKDEMKYTKGKDFMDLEMEQLMQEQMEKDGELKVSKNKKIVQKFSAWFNDDDDHAMAVVADGDVEEHENSGNSDDNCDEMDMENDDNDRANVEVIRKERMSGFEKQIINRDHPELPGMLKELKDIVGEMKMVYDMRQKAIHKRFDDAIEDSTLFIELLRTYSSTLCFYLQLKAKKISGDELKKHGIFGTLLKLKQRVKNFRFIYLKSIDMLNNLGDDWNRNEYLQQKRELFEYEKERENELHEKRMVEQMEKEKMQRIEKKKLRKQKKKEEKLKKKLFRKGFNRLSNMDDKLEGDDERRHVTQKIFKSQGLKRYRTKGIPRVKQRRKYEKKMKLWRMKGYKPYKQKLPNGRMEYNIRTNVTHSKRLT